MSKILSSKIQLIGTINDLTKRNYELQKQQKHKTMLMASLQHDLRNSLNPVVGYTELLLTGDYGDLPVEVVEILDLISKCAKQTVEFTSNIVHVLSSDVKTLDIRPSSIDLKTLIDVPGIPVVYSKDVYPETNVFVDSSSMYRVIQNLVSNARDFCNKETSDDPVRIEVSIGKADDIVVSIIDNGPGIQASMIPKLFKQFGENVSQKVLPCRPSSGIGLHVVKTIVEAHGKKVWYENNIPSGSKFSFTMEKI